LRISVSAPCRVDLAGGTLDIWPLGVLQRGALTVNAAIAVRVLLEMDLEAPIGHVEWAKGDEQWLSLGPDDAMDDLTAAVCFALRPKGGVRVRVVEQAPLGSGLGGSSSYAVALGRGVLALEDRSLGERALVALLRDLEARVLRYPTGVQDHWAALRGGVLAVHIEPGGELIEQLPVSGDWLGEHMTVLSTGIAHHSGRVNWQVFRRRLEGDEATTAALEAIADAARLCRQALIARDGGEVGAAMATEWAARKSLAPEICPAELERVCDAILDSGAWAVKATGAGGGGSLVVWHPTGLRDSLAGVLEEASPGGRPLPDGVVFEGCQVLSIASRGTSVP
jgi:D-glycero-alpha-D-manno-heptose-7-phosphate kinase